jgi:hypothetical protein
MPQQSRQWKIIDGGIPKSGILSIVVDIRQGAQEA